MYIILLIYLHNAVASDLNIHPNSVEDQLEAEIACGEEGKLCDWKYSEKLLYWTFQKILQKTFIVDLIFSRITSHSN